MIRFQLKTIPPIMGKEVDFYTLYSQVISRGGFGQVASTEHNEQNHSKSAFTIKGQHEKIMERCGGDFGFPGECDSKY